MAALHLASEAPSSSLGALIARRSAEAREAAGEHVGELEVALARVARIAGDVAEGGAAYPVGVRAVCRHLAANMALQQRALRGFAPAA